MIDINRLKNSKDLTNPFPILIIDDFLSKEETEEAINFLKKSSFDETVNQGRKNIRMGTKNFNQIIKNKNILSEIYNFFNEKNTYDFLYNKLYNISKLSNKRFFTKNIPNIFNKKYYQYKREIHRSNIKKRISNFLKTKFPFVQKLRKNFFFLEMNYSIATRGYNLPTHTDKKTRILVFLLYLNDLNENSGGALEIYSKIDKKTNSTDKKFFLENRFQPKKGKLIVFLSNPVSYHNVGNILDESKRYFCYGSYTSNNNLTWI